MHNISVFGTFGYLTANKTLPIGIKLDSAPDDVDMFQFDDVENAQVRRDLNGNIIVSSSTSLIGVNISVIAGSHEDRTLAALWSVNRHTSFSRSARDQITLIIKHAGDVGKIAGLLAKLDPINKSMIKSVGSGITQVYTSGSIIGGPASFGVGADGRRKTSTYKFMFADVTTATVEAGMATAMSAIANPTSSITKVLGQFK